MIASRYTYSRLPRLRSAGSSSGVVMSPSSSTAHGSMSTNRRSGTNVGVASASRATSRFAARFPALARVGLCAATAVPFCRLPAQRSTAPRGHAGPFLSTAPIVGGLLDAKVREAMTADVKYCFEDEDLDAAVRSMGEQKVRRLPVMSRDKRLVGIVSLGDVAVYADSKQTDAAVSAVSEPGRPHSQAG